MRQPVIFDRLKQASLRYAWLGSLDYNAAEELQHQIAAERGKGACEDTLLLLDHPHTYTLGRSASRNDILINPEECESKSIKVYDCDRGGQVTYHGPGQLVGYLIFNLRARRLSVPRFVWSVEEAMLLALKRVGLDSQRRQGMPGLWTGGRKIASLGFHISRGISRHGFSINVDPQLEYYDWIIPCGEKLPVSSLRQEIGTSVEMITLRSALLEAFDQVFSGSMAKGSLGVSEAISSNDNSLIESSVSSS